MQAKKKKSKKAKRKHYFIKTTYYSSLNNVVGVELDLVPVIFNKKEILDTYHSMAQYVIDTEYLGTGRYKVQLFEAKEIGKKLKEFKLK